MAKKRSILDRYTASQKYIVSRGKALTFPASPFKKELKNDEVYGAVIDMPMSPTVLSTLVCFVNGAANLYFSLGVMAELRTAQLKDQAAGISDGYISAK